MIFQTGQPGQIKTLKTILDDVLADLEKKMQYSAGVTGEVLPFLKNYLKLYALEMAVEPDQNIIPTIMPYLDSLELQHRFNATDEPYLRQLFDRVTKSFLVQDAFGENKHSFATILEVATCDFQALAIPAYQELEKKRTQYQYKKADAGLLNSLAQSDEAEKLDEAELVGEETNLIKYLTDNHRATRTPKPAKIFRPAHKYIAVVQADGDNVGKVINKLERQDYERFSSRLGMFALQAVQEISDFGGMNIYAGGDDLLFFAPLLYQNETLFDLLGRLDKLFTKAFEEFPVAKDDPHPTFSFGVSVTYYKFPLYEAREAATHQLFGVAKKTRDKNTIALRVQKHSGQPFGGAFRINSPSFIAFRELLRFSSEEDGQVLSSVMHKIRETDFLLKTIGHDPAALQAFFDNSFDEDVHTSEGKTFIKAVVGLLNACFAEQTDPALAIGAAYALLRMHRFLTSTELN